MASKKIYYITGENYSLENLEELCKNRIDIVQYRRKDVDTKTMIEEALSIKEITDEYNIPLIINDRLDVMLAVEADGVHLGSSDMPIATALKIAKDIVVGGTAKNLKQAKILVEQGADYIGVGAIYPSETKKDAIVTSVETLNEIAQNIEVPVFAIGGLTVENIERSMLESIEGICFSSYLEKSNVKMNVENIKKVMNKEVEI